MSSTEKIELGTTLQQLLNEHRQEYPEDQRDDHDLFHSVMEHLMEVGLVKKKAGKFILPKITRDA